MLTSIVAGLAWFYTESHWAGWRSYVMTALAGALAFFLCVFYRQVHGEQRKSFDWTIEDDLARLDPNEKTALAEFKDKNTVEYSADDPVVAGLQARGILVLIRSRQVVRSNDRKPWNVCRLFSLAPAARSYFEEHGW